MNIMCRMQADKFLQNVFKQFEPSKFISFDSAANGCL